LLCNDGLQVLEMAAPEDKIENPVADLRANFALAQVDEIGLNAAQIRGQSPGR
jgi:hypothetical protein